MGKYPEPIFAGVPIWYDLAKMEKKAPMAMNIKPDKKSF
jgi:hypothetical protein